MRAEDLLNKILSLVQKKRQLKDGSWLVQCPAHKDDEPSLHLTLSGDKLLIFCFAGCSYEEVLRRFGIEPVIAQKVERIEDVYVYEDELGNPLFRKIRYPGKYFEIERPEGSRWVKGGPDRYVIYRLPEVLRAKKVYIVEGEKDVETLRKFGLVATTNPHGSAEKLKPEYLKIFVGKEVTCVPDQDESGRRLGFAWVSGLWEKALSLRLVNLPPPYKDISEFLAKHSIEEFFALERSEKALVSRLYKLSRSGDLVRVSFDGYPYILESWPGRIVHNSQLLYFSLRLEGKEIDTFSGDLQDPLSRYRIERTLEERYPTGLWTVVLREIALALQAGRAKVYSGKDLPDLPPNWTVWILFPFILREGPSIIYGPQESLKSWLGLLLAKMVVQGTVLYPCELFQVGRVLWADWEVQKESMKGRLKKVGLEDERFLYVELAASFDEEYPKILLLVEEVKPDLLIIDSLGPAVGAELTSSLAANQFMNRIRSLNVPVLLIAHTPKHEESTVFGSTFFQNRARSLWRAQKLDESSSIYTVALVHRKLSFGNKYFPLKFIADFRNENEPKFELQKLPIGENPEWAQLPFSKRIIKCLETYGPLRKEELYELLGKPSREPFVKELWRLRKLKQIQEKRGLFTAIAEDSVPF